MRVCSGGCLRVVPDNVRFCDECKPTTKHDDDGIKSHTPGNTDRDRLAHLYGGPRWKKGIQPRVLQRNPVCKRCGLEPSVIVDHIVPASVAIEQVKASRRYPFDSSAGFFLMSNLQGLCRSCHKIKTDEDKAHAGEWPSVLDAEDRAPKKKWTF